VINPRTRRWRAPVLAVVAAVALPVVLVSCGDDDSAGTDDGAEQSGFCADLERVVTAGVELNQALFEGDAAALQDAVDEYPERAATAAESAPPEIADDLATAREVSERMLDQIEGIDPSDRQALEAAIAEVEVGPELDEAAARVADYARTECGFDPATIAGT
jgi:hypothetical protein